MKKSIALFAVISFMGYANFSLAQKDKKQDNKRKTYENHYRVIPAVETDEYKLEFYDVHSQAEFTKMRIAITNKTADYLVYKPKEVVFKYAHGEYKPDKKMVIIGPNSSVTKTLGVSGDDKFQVDKLDIVLDCFYSFSSTGTEQSAPNFDLPASTKDFEAGSFKCALKKINKETQETTASFQCTYSGNEFGLVNTGKLTVKLESGKEFINEKKTKLKILKPGDKMKVTALFRVPAATEADMQFANMQIVWKGTFSEAKATKLKGETINLELDPGKTEGKNK